MLLIASCGVVPAAAQVQVRTPLAGSYALPAPGMTFDGAGPSATPPASSFLSPSPLALTPIPVLVLSAAATETRKPGEFTQAPSWFDASRLTFEALVKSEVGGTAVMRYGWRSQYELTVYAFPGNPSVTFREYASNPMGHPKRTFEASLNTAAARAEAARIIRAVQARSPVEAKYQIALEAVLAFLDGK